FHSDHRTVYCWSAGSNSRFAVSYNECDSWSERQSVPFNTSCFAHYWYSKNTLYTGRDAIRFPTDEDGSDTKLIYATKSCGSPWINGTGNLWLQTKNLFGTRLDSDGSPTGTAGLVTISPRQL